MTAFDNWCALRNVSALPARPADVAGFITDCAPLGIAKLWPMVVAISGAHTRAGLADPTLGRWVSSALNDIAKIEPPQSWPKEHRQRFHALPYDLQIFVNKREAERDRAVRHAQNAVAATRKGKNHGNASADA